jgi:hypothetical protein
LLCQSSVLNIITPKQFSCQIMPLRMPRRPQ